VRIEALAADHDANLWPSLCLFIYAFVSIAIHFIKRISYTGEAKSTAFAFFSSLVERKARSWYQANNCDAAILLA
jgi:hypothetical protein